MGDSQEIQTATDRVSKSTETGPYEMTISLNVLNHLGLNLYSNHPSVLSEAVANAWDADATRVDITLDVSSGTVVVQDNGIGMTADDINQRFLRVGYQRRNNAETRRTARGRQVMGRKGIGKLSLFSIARTVRVETASAGERNALLMDVKAIQREIGNRDTNRLGSYRPQPLSVQGIDFDHGTRLTLTNLKRDISKTETFLARRLARRFSVLGAQEDFQVFIGGREVTPADIDHLRMVQYLWTYDDDGTIAAQAAKAKVHARTPLEVKGIRVRGWLGTVLRSTQLRDEGSGDDLNRIGVMVRGKLAQEDLLEEFNEGGVYRAYLVGELHADFLDLDDEDDIATSSRQRIREDDPRFEALKTFVQAELKHIQSQWSVLRSQAGTQAALDNPAIRGWFETLQGDTKRKAQSLFGRINQLTVDDENQRRELFAHGVLAFETMRHKDALDSFDGLAPTDLVALGRLFTESTDLEAVLYHRIVRARLAIIEKLADLTDDDAKERFLQEHIFQHLWLLDPGWERATDRHMEETMAKVFESFEQTVSDDEKASRLDIRYQRTSGLHVIVELKRASVRTTTGVLHDQVRRYRAALRKALKNAGREHEGVEIVCLVGKELKDWADPDGRLESAESLSAINARVLMYEELLSNARAAYKAYLDAAIEAGRIQAILDSLAEG